MGVLLDEDHLLSRGVQHLMIRNVQVYYKLGLPALYFVIVHQCSCGSWYL